MGTAASRDDVRPFLTSLTFSKVQSKVQLPVFRPHG